MSDDPTIYAYGIPQGRQLEGPGGRKGYLGSVGPDQRYTEEIGELLRKRIRELDPRKLEQHGKVCTDTTTGEEYTIARDYIDPVDPASSGVTAYYRSGELVFFLRPRAAEQRVESVELGEMRGERVIVR